MLKKLAITLIAVSTLAGCNRDTLPITYPVRWTSIVDLKSLDEIPAKLEEPVSLGDNSSGNQLEIERSLPDGTHTTVVIVTGAQYLEAIRKGWWGHGSGTTYQNTMESFFVRQTASLDLLAAARPSQRSFVADFRMDKATLRDLPWGMIHWTDLEYDVAYTDAATNAAITAHSENWIVFIDNRDNPSSQLSLDLLGVGDFNDDGTEDLLFYIAEVSLTGSGRVYHHIGMTRTNYNARLQVIDLPKGW